MADIYVATQSAVLFVGGERFTIHKDVTRVRDGHPILERHRGMFAPLTVHLDVEQATAAPGEKRELGVNQETIREWARGNGYDVSDRGKLPKSVVDAYHQREE